MDSAKNNHTIIIKTHGVARSGNDVLVNFNLGPLLLGKGVRPEVIQLLVVIVFATKDPHFIVINNSRVTSSGYGPLPSRWINFRPGIGFKSVLDHSVTSDTILKATENDHAIIV